jgi:hypothetical protein
MRVRYWGERYLVPNRYECAIAATGFDYNVHFFETVRDLMLAGF